MIYKVIYRALQLVYADILRPLLIKAIDDPDSEADEFALSIIDKLFDYKE